MKIKITLGTIVMAMMCLNLSANAVVTNDSMNTKQNAQESVLIFEKDTFDLGVQERSEVAMLEHILCKCNSSKEVRIKNVSITNMYGRVSASPRMAAGTKGTIVCIIDKKYISLGEHVDKITILTDSETSPEVSIFIKYNIIKSK